MSGAEPKDGDAAPVDLESLILELTEEVMNEIESTAEPKSPDRASTDGALAKAPSRRDGLDAAATATVVKPRSSPKVEDDSLSKSTTRESQLTGLSWSNGAADVATGPPSRRTSSKRALLFVTFLLIGGAATGVVMTQNESVSDYTVSASFHAVQGTESVSLNHGAALSPESSLQLSIDVSHPLHAYVVDVDATSGKPSLLFPHAYLETSNPLALGTSHLPGRDSYGDRYVWSGNPNGGPQSLVVITASTELPWISRLCSQPDEASSAEFARQVTQLLPGGRGNDARPLVEQLPKFSAGPTESHQGTTVHGFEFIAPEKVRRPKR